MNIMFHIGYHKTGTSWLQNIFFQGHPKIRLISDSHKPWADPLLKYLIKSKVGAFDPDEARQIYRRQKGLKGSAEENCVEVVSSERLSGHPFSGGFDSFRIAERIQGSFPAAKVLIVIRNQAEMIDSVYRQLVAEGYPGRIESLFNRIHWKTVGFDAQFFEYHRLVAGYFDLFGRGRVTVLPYAKMRDMQGQFLNNICRFLDIPNISIDEQISRKVINKSLSHHAASIMRLFNFFRNTELNQFPIIDINNSYIIYILKLLIKLSRNNEFYDKNELKNKINKYYYNSNKKLFDLTGISLFDQI